MEDWLLQKSKSTEFLCFLKNSEFIHTPKGVGFLH